MALQVLRPIAGETVFNDSTTSIASSPVAIQMVMSRPGTIERLYAASTGTTTGTITVAVTVNASATDIAGGLLTIPAGAGYIFAVYEPGVVGTTPTHVNEGDVVTFTPSGGTGSTIGGTFTLVLR